MECCICNPQGREYRLPALLSWRFSYGLGTPCDSFELTCLWQGGVREELKECHRFVARQGAERLFTGVVDEYRWVRDQGGDRLELCGRSLAALLLDNESEPVQYAVATLDDILHRHVTPYGVVLAGGAALPPVSGFVAQSGASQWQVVEQFARYYGGLPPRFDRLGRLVLEPLPQKVSKRLDKAADVLAAEYRDRRYGVLSEVLVRDKVRQTVQQVTDPVFQAQGGSCRRVMTMPGESGTQAMRHSGQFQLARARSERRRLTVTLATPFAAMPGELMEVKRPDWGIEGVWRVMETECGGDGAGVYTTLTLGLAADGV